MPMLFEQFLQQVVDSNLMSADEVAALIHSLPEARRPRDGDQLARELVRQRKLTAYQAQQIYKGKGKSLILGNYLVLDKLGQGGMGIVLKAQHRRMERLVALKVLSSKWVRNPESLRRFEREVKAAARLEHPNIVTAYDADEAGNRHFLVMQYVDGSDLSSRVRQHGVMPLDQAVDCILQAARGLQYAHQCGVVHRDIKPANLLLDWRGTIKILDMGLARLDSTDEQEDELTGSGQIMGTVDYMAPEQAVSTKHADGRADIYGLGATLWYLLTAQPLYAGETPVAKLLAHQSHSVPSLRAVRPSVPPTLDAVFRRMVAKTPEERFQTMDELIAALEPFRGPVATESAIPTVVEDTRLDEFLRGLQAATPAARRAGTAGGSSSPVIVSRAAPGGIAVQELTEDCSGPQVVTDARHQRPQADAGGPDNKTTVEYTAGQAALLSKLLEVARSAPASPTLTFDKKLVSTASPDLIQPLDGRLPAVQVYLAAQRRLSIVQQVHERETEGTLESERFISEVANQLPAGYHKGLAKRAAQAANRVRVYQALEEVIQTSASEREIVEVWSQLGEVRGRVLATPEVQQRVELAKARLPLLQALLKIPRNLDLSEQRRRVCQIWDPALLDDCPAAAPWRDLYEGSRATR